ncbi:hypothetical protein [Burkholderia sp. BE12]|uniref:hypothetical protein n=1 Tax=Burkholderia sp. BE12 TaxID=2082394 RepID=UPI000CF42B0A|nr:hypothetical protein [Burkholderia sp. BE12]
MKTVPTVMIIGAAAIVITVLAWPNDSVDYYYNHKIEARQKFHECVLSMSASAPEKSRRREVMAAMLEMENSNVPVIPTAYGITDTEYTEGFNLVTQSSNACWNALTALRKP